jgi:glutathione S-transferase
MDTVLFYTPGSCSLACMIALHWQGDPYRLCRVEKDVRRTTPYLRINPRGQVPALRVDGKPLVETDAILAHIADRKPAAQLLPANGTFDRDVANQWLAYLGSGFHPPFWPYFTPQRYAKDESHHAAIRDAAIDSIREQLAFVDAHLAGRDFIQSDRISVLDAYLHAMDRWANKIVDMPTQYPNVWRHQKMVSRDPAARVGVKIERGDGEHAPDGPYAGHVSLADI